ncbi:MAG: ABC transporter permease [Armatimonadota bacterium]
MDIEKQSGESTQTDDVIESLEKAVIISNRKRLQQSIIRTLAIPEVGILIPLIAMCLFFSYKNDAFYSDQNIINMLRSISFTGLIAIPMTYVFIAAGLDLSVGSVAGLAGVVCGLAMTKWNIPVPVAILFGLGIGVVTGLCNGTVSVYLRIPSFIVTLGMMYVARGAVFVLTQGETIYPLPDSFNSFGKASLMGLPYSVIILLVVAVFGDFVLRRTTYGRKVYAVGGNEEVAALAGINVKRIKVSTYILVSIASAAAGILLATRMASATSAAGETWEMQAISAVIIGGTSMFGGVGTILGVVLGAAMMGVLSAGMVFTGVSTYWQNIVLGIIMVVAVGLDQLRRSRLGL